MKLCGKIVCIWYNRLSVRSFMVDPFGYFLVKQCSKTGVTKAVVCIILSVGRCM